MNYTLSSLGSRGPIFPTPENRLRHKLTIARNVANTWDDKIVDSFSTQLALQHYDEPQRIRFSVEISDKT